MPTETNTKRVAVLLLAGAPQIAEPANIVTVDYPCPDGTRGRLVPVFRDQQKAEAFRTVLRDNGNGMTPIELEASDVLGKLLKKLRDAGVTHFQFHGSRGKYDPVGIREAITGLERMLSLPKV
jgi:hypothetical protein